MIEVIHRGYVIRYNENADEWSCSDAGYYSSPKLSNVKQRIDKILLDVRKKAALDVFSIGGSADIRAGKNAVRIIEYLGREKVSSLRANYGSGGKVDGEHKVAAFGKDGWSEKKARREYTINNLMPDTSEAHAAFARYEEACAREREAKQATKVAFEAIPRVTIDMISELVRIADAPETEKDATA